MMREYSITTMEGSCTPQKTDEPSMAGVKNGRPATRSTIRNQSATAAAGSYLGSHGGVDVWLLVRTLIGVALVAAGTNAFNQVRERDVDARMRRTERRPLPSGRLTPRAAALFAGVISVAGVVSLAVTVNPLTAGLAALTLASYVLLYTPLKRKTTLNTLIR